MEEQGRPFRSGRRSIQSSPLTSGFAKPKITDGRGEVHLYAETGVASRFGVYVTHLSIVVIFIGAILGNVFGFKSYVNIPDGKEASHLDARGGKEHIDLPFSVRNNRFWVETYPNGQPRKYASDLSVIESGREVLRKTITVNDPLAVQGNLVLPVELRTGGAKRRRWCRSAAPTAQRWAICPSRPTSRSRSTGTEPSEE